MVKRGGEDILSVSIVSLNQHAGIGARKIVYGTRFPLGTISAICLDRGNKPFAEDVEDPCISAPQDLTGKITVVAHNLGVSFPTLYRWVAGLFTDVRG